MLPRTTERKFHQSTPAEAPATRPSCFDQRWPATQRRENELCVFFFFTPTFVIELEAQNRDMTLLYCTATVRLQVRFYSPESAALLKENSPLETNEFISCTLSILLHSSAA